MITHAWLIYHNVQQFQVLKHLSGICFIAATMGMLLIIWLEDWLPVSKTLDSGVVIALVIHKNITKKYTSIK